VKFQTEWKLFTTKFLPKLALRQNNKLNKTILKENKVGGLTLSDCTIYYKATVRKKKW
jgi:hypothetical protein